MPNPLAFPGALIEVIGLGLYPGNKTGDIGVRQECLDMVIGMGELGLGEQSVNLSVAYPMQILRFSPALGFGHQMVSILF